MSQTRLICAGCGFPQIHCECKTSEAPSNDGLNAVALAKRLHETYERLAPKFDYKTRHESAVPWNKVPEKNKMLMIAVCETLLKEGI